MADTLSIIIDAENRAKRALSQVESQVRGVTGGMSGLGKVAGVAAAGVAAAGTALTIAGAGMAKLGYEAVQGASQLEQQKVAFETLLGSADAANAAIAGIVEDAKATPFELPGLIKGNQLLIAAGVSAEDARVDFLGLGNAVSAVGGGQAELDRLASNLQQIRAVGNATAMDIKQFGSAGIPIFDLLADSMGKTVEEVAAMDATSITYDDITDALNHASAAGGKFEGAMEKQSKTFSGVMSNIKDVIGITLTEIANESGLFETVSNVAQNALGWIEANKDMLKNLASQGFQAMIAAGTIAWDIFQRIIQVVQIGADQFRNYEGAMGKVRTIVEAVAGFVNDYLIPAVKTVAQDVGGRLIESFQGLLQIIKDNEEPLKTLATIFGVVIVGSLIFLAERFGWLATTVMDVVGRIIQIVSSIVSAVTNIVHAIGALFRGDLTAAFNFFGQAMGDVVEAIINFFAAPIDVIKNFIDSVIGFFATLYDVLIGHSIVPDLINGIIDWFWQLPGRVAEALMSFVSGAIDKAGEMASGFSSAVQGLIDGAWQWGAHLWDNFKGGLTNAFEGVKSKINDGVGWIQDKLSFSKNKYLPTEIWGAHMMENLAMGIGKGANEVESAVTGVMDGVTGTLTADQGGVMGSASTFAAAGAGSNGSSTINNSTDQSRSNVFNVYQMPGESQGEFASRLKNKMQLL